MLLRKVFSTANPLRELQAQSLRIYQKLLVAVIQALKVK